MHTFVRYCRCRFWPRRHNWVEWLVVVAIGAMLFDLLVWPVLASQWGRYDGRSAAAQDLAAGRLQMRIGGRNSARTMRRDAFIEQRYGVHVVPSGCVVTDYRCGFDRGYNETIAVEVARRSLPKLDTIFEQASHAADSSGIAN